ncbi:hypothetical protein DV737_g1216, partial [Chaetothyriales sp. CBS 132003]
MAEQLSKAVVTVGDALPVNLAYAQPAGPGISTMIGDHENVVVRLLTHQDVHPYLSYTINCRIKLKLSVKHNSLKIMQFQGHEETSPASLFLNRINGSMSQLFYIPNINQIQVAFDMMNELKSMGTAGTWLNNHALPEARLVSHSLESISVVKIIIGIADKGFAMSLVQSFQTAFGVQLNKGLCENGFRAVWEYTKAKVAKSPNDKQARLDFAYAYALLHGSGQARRSDKDTWDRRCPSMQ